MSMRLAPLVFCVCTSAMCSAAGQEDVPAPDRLGEPITLREWVAIGPLERGGREPFAPDAVYANYLLADAARPPQADEELTDVTGRRLPWRRVQAEECGQVAGDAVRRGYAYACYRSDRATVALAELRGASTFFLNHQPHVGDPYGYGFVRIPVLLAGGENHFYVRGVRGGFSLRLLPPPDGIGLNPADATLPDVREGDPLDAWGAVVVINADVRPAQDGWIESGDDERFARSRRKLPTMAPLSLMKVPVRVRLVHPISAEDCASGEVSVPVTVASGTSRQTVAIPLRVRSSGQAYKQTFQSTVDGSIQYYAVLPPAEQQPERRYGLFLTLHGAGVEACGQAEAYSPKNWAYVVAPTNRRPFGFDWEDWGRRDALEVLDAVLAGYPIDADRVYLTGHSMGGHGAWNLAVNAPGRFAAVAPSAGWISFWRYGSRRALDVEDAVGTMFRRCIGASDTLALLRNLERTPIYVLHGADDDNVPADQARTIVKHLQAFHRDFVYHEEPDAGHWWDKSPRPGADCVDWPAMIDFCARQRRPSAPLRVAFRTPGLWANSSCRWVTILSQARPNQPSTITAQADPAAGRIDLTAENVRSLSLRPQGVLSGSTICVVADGQQLQAKCQPGRAILLERDDAGWRLGEPEVFDRQHHQRCGPFKQAFDKRFLLVYGTQGSAAENAAVLAQARFDAENWWYRGNGLAELIPDTQFDPRQEPERNVVLYGHREMNRAYDLLIEDSPIDLQRGGVRLGKQRFDSPDLGCLFIRPRPGSRLALVAVIGGTGLEGLRLTHELRTFVSGVGYPDLMVFDRAVLEQGSTAVRVAGFWDACWRLRPDDLAFSTKPTTRPVP